MSAPGRTHRRRIGEILVNEGLITAEQLEEALHIQRKTGELLGSILMDMGLVAEADIAKTICIQYQLPFICLANYDFDEKLVGLFPKEFLHRHKLFPFDKVGETLLMLVTEIPQESVIEEIPKLTRLNAALYAGYVSEVSHHLNTLAPLVTPAPAGVAVDAEQPSERRSQRETSAEATEEPRGTTLVFGSSKESFLEELDSTWDSIFQQVQSTAETAKSPPPPKGPKPKK
jgi:type IV pilus assembly protein PilB